jgi:hypothetical protein
MLIISAFFSIFFTGMSMPMSTALVSHLVGYNMTWSTTIKTVEKSNFFLQIPLIWKRFYPQLVFFSLAVVSTSKTSSATPAMSSASPRKTSRLPKLIANCIGCHDRLVHVPVPVRIQDHQPRSPSAPGLGRGKSSPMAIRLEPLVLVILCESWHYINVTGPADKQF